MPRHQTFDWRRYKNDAETGVLVCGIPSSGNRVVASVFGAHGVNFHILHWPKMRQLPDWPVLGVYLVVRDYEPREASIKTRAFAWAGDHAEYLKTYEGTVRVASELALPIYPVRYEAFVADPEGVAQLMLAHIGVMYDRLPFDVIDGNAKWLSQSRP